MPQEQGEEQSNSDPFFGKPTQLGLRISVRHSYLFARVREWLAKQPLVDLDGATGSGPEIAKTETTLARFILESQIDNLFADLQIDEAIDKAAEFWSIEYIQTDPSVGPEKIEAHDVIQWMLKEETIPSFPRDMLEKIVEQGLLRYRELGTGNNNYVGGRLLSERFARRFPETTQDEEAAPRPRF